MRTRQWLSAWCVVGSLAITVPMFVQPVAAQVAKAKPKGATAQCKDGTFSTAASRRGACSGHGGVATWFADKSEPNRTAEKTETKAPQQTTKNAAPTDATAQCKDGTYSKAKSQRGACSGHGGVRTWLGDSNASPRREASNPTPRSTAPEAAPAPTPVPNRRPPATASNVPANATAKCRDGSFSFAANHRGACSHHGGVAEWYK
jgi:hypothetical protein